MTGIMFMDVADMEIIVRAAKNLRVKRVSLTFAKERLDEWRKDTLQAVPFERYLLDCAENGGQRPNEQAV